MPSSLVFLWTRELHLTLDLWQSISYLNIEQMIRMVWHFSNLWNKDSQVWPTALQSNGSSSCFLFICFPTVKWDCSGWVSLADTDDMKSSGSHHPVVKWLRRLLEFSPVNSRGFCNRKADRRCRWKDCAGLGKNGSWWTSLPSFEN